MALGREGGAHFGQGGVAVGAEQGKDHVGLRLDRRRATIAALPLGRDVARRQRLGDPADRA